MKQPWRIIVLILALLLAALPALAACPPHTWESTGTKELPTCTNEGLDFSTPRRQQKKPRLPWATPRRVAGNPHPTCSGWRKTTDLPPRRGGQHAHPGLGPCPQRMEGRARPYCTLAGESYKVCTRCGSSGHQSIPPWGITSAHGR